MTTATGTKRRADPVLVGLWLALAIVALIWLIPFVFILFTSLKSNPQLFRGSTFAPPSPAEWGNYLTAWETGNFSRYAFNSFVIAIIKVPLGIFIASMAAFALTRLHFRYQRVLLLVVVLGSMIPIQVALGPIFRIILNLGLLSTYLGLLLPYIAFGLPFQIFLMQGFFRSLPRELDEAAYLDGCSRLTLFWQIILPLALPMLAALFILDFVATWNEFGIALVIMQSSSMWTIPLGLMGFQGLFGSQYGQLNAGIMISVVPVLIVYFFFQRYFISGLASGAVKG